MRQKRKQSQLSVSEIRRERERAEMTGRIMDIAREMFIRDGYEAVTLRRVAARIEYSPAAIYKYFKDKQTLIKAIIRKDSQDLRENLLLSTNLKDPVEQLLEMSRLYAIWGITHPNHYRLMLDPPPAWKEEEDLIRIEEPAPLEQEGLILLYSAVKQCHELGLIRKEYDDPSLVAATLWGAIHGVIMLEIKMSAMDRTMLGVSGINFEKRIETIQKILLDGFIRR